MCVVACGSTLTPLLTPITWLRICFGDFAASFLIFLHRIVIVLRRDHVITLYGHVITL